MGAGLVRTSPVGRLLHFSLFLVSYYGNAYNVLSFADPQELLDKYHFVEEFQKCI